MPTSGGGSGGKSMKTKPRTQRKMIGMIGDMKKQVDDTVKELKGTSGTIVAMKDFLVEVKEEYT